MSCYYVCMSFLKIITFDKHEECVIFNHTVPCDSMESVIEAAIDSLCSFGVTDQWFQTVI